MAERQAILQHLFLQFALMQIVASFFWFVLYRQIKRMRPGSFRFIVIPHTVIYAWLNILLISDLLSYPDLCIGGITFAFEMGAMILAGVFTGILLIIWFIFSILHANKH